MKIFISLLGYLPYVLSAVQSVEAAVGSAPGSGATKKQLVLSAVTAAASVGEQIPEAHVSAISAMIDGIVALLNKTNLLGFGKVPAAA